MIRGKAGNQRVLADDADGAHDAARAMVNRRDRVGPEDLDWISASGLQASGDERGAVGKPERGGPAAQRHPLFQLAQPWLPESCLEFRLADQQDLQELGTRNLEVGEQ